MRRFAVVLSLFAVMLATSTGSAQQVQGTLLAAETGTILPFGVVELLTDDFTVVATVTADIVGNFHLVAPAPGAYALRGSHLNTHPIISAGLELSAGQLVTVELALSLNPIELDPLMVSVRPEYRQLVRKGFYQRAKSELGSFVTPEQVERWRPFVTSDLLRRMPGIRLEADGSFPGRYHIVMGRNAPSLFGGRCEPSIWVDDMYLPGYDLDQLPAQDLFAVEVYRSPLQTPQRYRGRRSCGAVVVWTGKRISGG